MSKSKYLALEVELLSMEAIGVLAGVLTLLTYVPQAVKTIGTRKTRDLSISTLILLCGGALVWTIYGLGKHLPAVGLTNLVVTLLGVTILSIKLKNTLLVKYFYLKRRTRKI